MVNTEKKGTKRLISNSVKSKNQTLSTKVDAKERLSLSEGVNYLNELGFKISKSKVYDLTMRKQIPFYRFGGKTILFKKDELESWAESQCIPSNLVESEIKSGRP
jgi:excisionase family DNA binding protein